MNYPMEPDQATWLANLKEQWRLNGIKSRLKKALRRKPRPARVRIKDEEDRK